MTNTGRCARLAQKTKARRLVSKIAFADDLQRHGTSQIDVERFVSDAHRAAAQLDRRPVFSQCKFIMLKSLRRVFRRRLDRIFRSRLAGLNFFIESLAKHAHRTEFHCPRKLTAAVRADVSRLRAHEDTALQTRPEPRTAHEPRPRSLPAPPDSGSRRLLKLHARVSSWHRVQDLESKTLGGRIQWIGDERLIDRG